MNLVFMGTPDFSVPVLEALVNAGHNVTAVVTQPDKPKGRGNVMQMTPVKEKALELGIKVYQPERVKGNIDFYEEMKALKPDAAVVVAFGQILPKEILDIPALGCINVHASILPMYRGAAPIQWVIINGETKTGVTTMYMDEGLDTGDMLLKEYVAIDKDETGGSLFDKLSRIGGPLAVKTLEGLEKGTIERVKQTGETCYASIIKKSLGSIDWSLPAVKIERLIRGLNPWPSAYSALNGRTIKLWSAEVDLSEYDGCSGEIVKIENGKIYVKTGEGALVINELQAEGKKRMETDAFLRGNKIECGMRFGILQED